MTSTLDVPRLVVAREHVVESPDSRAAVVSDIGLRRERNEDTGAVLVDGDWTALVVCDGVGSSRDGAWASAAATAAARQALLTARVAGVGRGAQLTAAHSAAARAVAASDVHESGRTPPATTFVAAVSDGHAVAAISVGDSRAYWLPDGGATVQLTTDDSMAAMLAAAGSAATPLAGRYAHMITRWLGAGSPHEAPRVTMFPVSRPGWLLVCSDGLWNCLPDEADLNDLVSRAAAHDALAKAELLVSWANWRGGRDNVTVALARVDPTAERPRS